MARFFSQENESENEYILEIFICLAHHLSLVEVSVSLFFDSMTFNVCCCLYTGMVFLKFPAADVASDAFEKLSHTVQCGKPLFVKLLPTIHVSTLSVCFFHLIPLIPRIGLLFKPSLAK